MLEESFPAVWASMYSWFTPTLLFLFLNLMIGTIAIASGFGTQKKNPHHQQQQQPDYHEEHFNNNQPPLIRTPSMLDRLKSINLYSYRSQELNPFSTITTTTHQQQQQEDHHEEHFNNNNQPPLIRNPSMLDRIKSINLYRYRSQDLNPFSTITTTTHQPPETEQTQQVLDSLDLFHHHQEPEETPIYENLEDHHVTRTKSDTKPTSGDMPVKLSKKMKKSASVKSAFDHFEEEEVAKLNVRRPSTVREGKSKASDLQTFGDDEEVDAKADDFINKFKQQLKLQRLDSILRYKETVGRGGK